MHEFSVVLSIVDIATKEASKAQIDSFSEIELEIGCMSGVVLESLEFAWPAAVENTVLSKAQKTIHLIKAQAKCLDCNHIFEINSLFQNCPKCNSIMNQLLKGKELKIKSLVY